MRLFDAGILHRNKHSLVQRAVGDDDSSVFDQFPSVGEVEGFAGDVGDRAAGFLGDEDSAGVVPDFFAVAGSSWQAEVDVRFASGDDGVFRLAVESRRLVDDAEFRSDLRRVAV